MSVTFLRPLQLLLKNHNVLRWCRSTTGRKKIGRHLSHRRWCLLPLTICCCKIFSNHLLSQGKICCCKYLPYTVVHFSPSIEVVPLHVNRSIFCVAKKLRNDSRGGFFVHIPMFEFMKTFCCMYYYELRFLNDHICIEN